MQKVIYLLLGVTLFINCQNDKYKASKPLLVCTIYPYYIICKELSGDLFNSKLLIPANASPHTYAPRPDDIRKLAEADLIIRNGLGLEYLFRKQFRKYNKKVFTAAEQLKPEDKIYLNKKKTASTIKNKHETAHNHKYDPHIWLSASCMLKIAKGILHRFIDIKPQEKQALQNNYDRFSQEVRSVHNKITAERSELQTITLVTLHRAFAYFAREYELDIKTSVIESPGKKVNLKKLRQLKTVIQKNNIKTIYNEPQLNPRTARILSKEFNLQTAVLDPLGFSFEIKSYADLIYKNWEIIKKNS
ncbi:MAG TPA: metal ABC transporter substrate-binding protein [Spirochaetota bacterium]|nr:metal ABC transporter substrate-binding protein [Spirochaetota bacterium]